jgi:hypothetical protein
LRLLGHGLLEPSGAQHEKAAGVTDGPSCNNKRKGPKVQQRSVLMQTADRPFEQRRQEVDTLRQKYTAKTRTARSCSGKGPPGPPPDDRPCGAGMRKPERRLLTRQQVVDGEIRVGSTRLAPPGLADHTDGAGRARRRLHTIALQRA